MNINEKLGDAYVVPAFYTSTPPFEFYGFPSSGDGTDSPESPTPRYETREPVVPVEDMGAPSYDPILMSILVVAGVGVLTLGLMNILKNKPEEEQPKTEEVVAKPEEEQPKIEDVAVEYTYDVFDAGEIQQAVSRLNLSRNSDVLSWGKKITELSATEIMRQEADILAYKKQSLKQVRLVTRSILDELKQTKSIVPEDSNSTFLKRVFAFCSRLVTGEATKKAYTFEGVISNFEKLLQAIYADSDTCLEIMREAEDSMDDIKPYGLAIEAHIDALKTVRNKVISGQTMTSELERSLVDESDSVFREDPEIIRNRLQSRIDALELSHDTWEQSLATMKFVANNQVTEMEQSSALQSRIEKYTMTQIRAALEIEKELKEAEISSISSTVDNARVTELNQKLEAITAELEKEIQSIDDAYVYREKEVDVLSGEEQEQKKLLIEYKKTTPKMLPFYPNQSLAVPRKDFNPDPVPVFSKG